MELSIYLGVPLNNLIPFKYPYVPLPATPSAYAFRDDLYFVWTIDGSTSGDHLFVLKGIEHYYKHLLGRFKTVVLASPNERTHERHGPVVDFANPRWKAFSDAASSGILADKVLLVGEPPSLAGYYKILEGAAFFLHFKRSGGMSAGLMDAVAVGLPIICTDYPCSRHTIESTLDVSYLDPKLATHYEIAESLARFHTAASAAPVRRKVAAKANLEPIARELVSLINPPHEMASA
jgi:glycosyltransferase involved in cell wall biosynthesis